MSRTKFKKELEELEVTLDDERIQNVVVDVDGESVTFDLLPLSSNPNPSAQNVTICLSRSKDFPSTAYVAGRDPISMHGDSALDIVLGVIAILGRGGDLLSQTPSESPSLDRNAAAADEPDVAGTVEPLGEGEMELRDDVKRLKDTFGEKIVKVRIVDEVVVIDMDIAWRTLISESLAAAWGLDPAHDIWLRVACGIAYRHGANPEKVHFFKPGVLTEDGEEVTFALQFQLDMIARTYVMATWQHGSPPFRGPQKDATEGGTASALALARTTVAVPAEVSELVKMGFGRKAAEKALELSDNDVESALALCLDCPEIAAIAEDTPQSADASTEPAAPATKVLKRSDEGRSYLVELIKYVRSRLPTLNQHCVICDLPHPFGSMIKSSVCYRNLCAWSFQNLGVAANSLTSLATSHEVVDLLVFLARIASSSNRKEVIFDPFPHVFDPDDKTVIALDPEKKDFARARSLLEKIPPIGDLARTSGTLGEIEITLRDIDRLASPLLNWVIASNRCYIVKLPKEKLLSEFESAQQFLMLSSSPDREDVFKSLRAKHGSVYAFHGSPIENWHSILHYGLKNASGTNLQLHGAAHGNGIYMSPESSVAAGYCGYANGPKCITLCEVINTPEIRKSSNIWVVPNALHVVTRLLFVFREGRGYSGIAFAGQIAEKVRAVVEYFGIQ